MQPGGRKEGEGRYTECKKNLRSNTSISLTSANRNELATHVCHQAAYSNVIVNNHFNNNSNEICVKCEPLT